MPNSQRTISIIIPACNEEGSLPRVLADIPEDLVHEVIVVNNASTDNTPEVARQAGARVVDEPVPGYGRACLSGIATLSSNTDIVVFLDGDHSDHPEQMERLINPIRNGGFDMVIGSRVLGKREKGALTPQARWGNRLATFLIRRFWGFRYTDLGPFRAIRFDALKKLNMRDEDFGWTVEMQIKALEAGLKVTEVPVDYRRRIGRSKISGTLKGAFLAGKKILGTIFNYKFLKR